MELDRPETPFSHRLQQPVGSERSVEQLLDDAYALEIEQQRELVRALAAWTVPRLTEETARSFIDGLRNVPVANAAQSRPSHVGAHRRPLHELLDDVLTQAMGAQARILHELSIRVVGEMTQKERSPMLEEIERRIEATLRGETPKGELP